MNTIFLDINDNFKNSDSTNKLHGNFINRKFLKFFIYKDILNNSLGKKIYIQFDIEYLYKSLKKENFTMRLSFLKYLINKEFTNNDTVNLVFSNFFDENQDIIVASYGQILKQNIEMEYECMERTVGYFAEEPKDQFASASYIREHWQEKDLKDYLPKEVYPMY